MQDLTYSLAPQDWAICFQHDCLLSDNCLRHAIAQLAPPGLTHHTTVLPAARQDDHCRLFATKEPVRIARGMKRLLVSRSTGLASTIRKGLFDIFGSRSQYYRYRDGEYDISPEQQARVISHLQIFGYQNDEPFDNYNEQYYFP